MPDLDCTRCGACCGRGWTIDLDAADTRRFLTDPRLARLVEMSESSGFKLARMRKRTRSRRCIAFRGRVGGPCRCSIYADRADVCHDFEPGDDACIESRRILQVRGRKP